jgi:hypothetical protein
MSGQGLNREQAVQLDFSRFVAEHAAQALLWYVVGSGEGGEKEVSQTCVDRVEFDIDGHHIPGSETDFTKGRFSLKIFTEAGLSSQGITLRRNVGETIQVSDEQGEMSVVLDDPKANKPKNELRSVAHLIEHLKELEKRDCLIPAGKRRGWFNNSF